MKVINIGGKDYTFEFTIEASLHKECAEKITKYMLGVVDAKSTESLQVFISTMSDLPETALTVFYAGLLENHSDEIKNEKDAKKLIKEYFSEHKDDGKDNFYEIMNLMTECMSDDGFFRQIGLEQFLEKLAETKAEKKPKTPKAPQDRKQKTTKATEK